MTALRIKILFVLLCSAAYSNDCVPLTFTALSYIVREPVEKETWFQELKPTEASEVPTLEVSLKAWSKVQPRVRLEKVYTGPTRVIQMTEISLDTGEPYFWVGYPSEETATGTDLHAAIVYFFDDYACVVNTIRVTKINGKDAFNFYIEAVTHQDLIKRSVYIYRVKTTRETKDYLSISMFTGVH